MKYVIKNLNFIFELKRNVKGVEHGNMNRFNLHFFQIILNVIKLLLFATYTSDFSCTNKVILSTFLDYSATPFYHKHEHVYN